jgi:hypothetical protein
MCTKENTAGQGGLISVDRTPSDSLSACSTNSQTSQPANKQDPLLPTALLLDFDPDLKVYATTTTSCTRTASVGSPILIASSAQTTPVSSPDRKPSDAHTPLSSTHADFWGREALQLRMDLRKQVCPPRTKRSHSSPSLVAADSSTDAYSPASARKPSPPDYSPSRLKPPCKAKPIKVSSGNRFYAEVIRQRLKEAQGAHALARDLPIRDKTLPVEKGEALGVPSARVPSSTMLIRTQSAEMDAALYQLTLTRCRRASF